MATVPNDTESEERMLGAMILGSYDKVIDAGVTIDWFWGGDTRYAFSVMEKLSQDGKEVNEATVTFAVCQDKKNQMVKHLDIYINKTGHQDNWTLWLPPLKQAFFRRKTFQAALELKNASMRTDIELDEVFAAIDNSLSELRIDQTNAEQTQLESVRDIAELLSNLWHGKRDVLGFSCGYPDIDRVLGGLRRQNLIILAARPAMGKTSLITNMAIRIAQAGHPVGFFSLEMSRMELNMRMAAVIGKVNIQSIINRTAPTNADLLKATKALPEVAKLPITINDKAGVPINYIRQCARRMVRDGAKVIFLDYLQLVQPSKGRSNRNDEITIISNGLKHMAKELNVPVVALSQMNREFEKTTHYKGKEVKRRPRMSDLRDGGAIEQDADSIGFLWEHEDVIFLGVEKNRNGQTGDVPLTWIKEHTRFESAAKEHRGGSMIPGDK